MTLLRPPLRVMHLRDSPWVDGPGRTILETGARIDPERVEYHIAPLCAADESGNLLLQAARDRGLKVAPIRDGGGYPSALVKPIVEQARRLEVDIIHSSDFRSSAAAVLAARHLKTRLVVTAHGWIANTWRRRLVRMADKILLRRFDRIIMVSSATRHLVPRWWLPDSRVRVLHNALVLESYGAGVLRCPRPAVDPDRVVSILNVGRLSPEKGQVMLLNAVAKLVSRWPGLRLMFAGVGPMEGELRESARLLGISDRVEFLGYVADMPELYARTDLLVQSSLTEGLPNVVLEAAYLRVPMVVTSVGGTGEVVRHRETAWLTPPTLQGLFGGIEAFLEDPAPFVRMADAAHGNIVRNFSFAARTEQQMSIYEELRH